jgi:hypothetical protein
MHEFLSGKLCGTYDTRCSSGVKVILQPGFWYTLSICVQLWLVFPLLCTYYKYLNTLHISDQLAIFSCTIWFVDLLRYLLLPLVLSWVDIVPQCTSSIKVKRKSKTGPVTGRGGP